MKRWQETVSVSKGMLWGLMVVLGIVLVWCGFLTYQSHTMKHEAEIRQQSSSKREQKQAKASSKSSSQVSASSSTNADSATNNSAVTNAVNNQPAAVSSAPIIGNRNIHDIPEIRARQEMYARQARERQQVQQPSSQVPQQQPQATATEP